MAQAKYLLRTINQIPKQPSIQAKLKPQKLHLENENSTNSRKPEFPLITKKTPKNRRRLISIPTAEGKWGGDCSCDYRFSLRDLRLSDLMEDERKDAQVCINLIIERHASFGFSVDGKIFTSFTRKCSKCSSPYCKMIDTSFSVWVLASTKDDTFKPEIGGDDPSVIYVRPGYEADLDTLVEETIRLAASVEDNCSEECKKSERTVQYGDIETDVATVDTRWYKLLELRKTM